ncbi:excisionase [Frisingicoccus sp.]|uniref:excisionase n=1 Tax=Frisingicoccus sp. TaxID=1918627 RepID=UPI00399BC0A7
MKKEVNLENKFLLTFDEASKYFGIGENKLRNMASYEDNPDWILYNGCRRLIKRVRLEEILMESETI